MTSLPIHPKIVHFPLALAVIMPLLMTGIFIAWKRGALPRAAWLIALAVQLVVSVSAFVALETGEDEAERVEVVVSESYIEEHEENAKPFVASTFGVLVIAALAAFVKNETLARRLAMLGILGALGSAFMAISTGHTGGKLVYEHGAADVYTRPPSTHTPPRARPDHD